MTEGTIGIDRAKGFIGWCIKTVTGKPWDHAKTYLKGFTWEWTVWWIGYWWRTGVKVTKGHVKADAYLSLKQPMTEQQQAAELAYWLENLNTRKPYNFPKFIAMIIIYPCRKFFQRIKWIPFDNPIWGEECSAGVDEGKKAAGIDLLPGRREGYTCPGDLFDSGLLKVGEL